MMGRWSWASQGIYFRKKPRFAFISSYASNMEQTFRFWHGILKNQTKKGIEWWWSTVVQTLKGTRRAKCCFIGKCEIKNLLNLQTGALTLFMEGSLRVLEVSCSDSFTRDKIVENQYSNNPTQSTAHQTR